MKLRHGLAAGLLLHAFEAVQAILLIPLFARVLPAADASFWVALTAAAALVPLALAGHTQPLVRAIAGIQGDAAGLPAAWPRARAQLLPVATLLLVLGQAAFLAWLAWPPARPSGQQLLAAGLYLLALQFRLRAFTEFIVLNGTRQVGRDKLFLLGGSAASLAALLLLSLGTRNIAAMAAGYLLVNAALLWRVRRVTGREGRTEGRTPVPITGPSRREIAGLVLLNLGGYLNLNTDVVLANRLLAPEAALQYAFWSRLFMAQVAVVGLWTQLRFPFWVGEHRLGGGELPRPAVLLALGSTLLFGGWWVLSHGAWLPGPRLPVATAATLAASAVFAGIALVLGQALTAQRRYRFVLPSAVVACASPLLALLAARALGAELLAVGYLAGNLLLCAAALATLRAGSRE